MNFYFFIFKKFVNFFFQSKKNKKKAKNGRINKRLNRGTKKEVFAVWQGWRLHNFNKGIRAGNEGGGPKAIKRGNPGYDQRSGRWRERHNRLARVSLVDAKESLWYKNRIRAKWSVCVLWSDECLIAQF